MHAVTEKIRRAELLSCYRQLGSTFLPETILCRTNRHDIVELVFIIISFLFIFEYKTVFILILVYVKCWAIL
jgi:hypothetical protein